MSDDVDSVGTKPLPRFASEVLRMLNSHKVLSLRELWSLWVSLSASSWKAPAEIYTRLGHQILETGEPLLAYDIFEVGLKRWSGHVRMRQLQALALAQSGATGRAQGILEALAKESSADGETLGILARTWKDLW